MTQFRIWGFRARVEGGAMGKPAEFAAILKGNPDKLTALARNQQRMIRKSVQRFSEKDHAQIIS